MPDHFSIVVPLAASFSVKSQMRKYEGKERDARAVDYFAAAEDALKLVGKDEEAVEVYGALRNLMIHGFKHIEWILQRNSENVRNDVAATQTAS